MSPIEKKGKTSVDELTVSKAVVELGVNHLTVDKLTLDRWYLLKLSQLTGRRNVLGLQLGNLINWQHALELRLLLTRF